jgi:lambda family phage minor tail protein L
MTETIDSLPQQPALDEFIELFELDATSIGGDIYRFISGAYAIEPVTWQGNTYLPIPFESSGFTADGSGVLATPHLKVANINLAFSGVAIAFHDLVGCTVTRHRTFRRFLDGQSEADPTAEFDPDVFRIDRKVAQNKIFVEWELAAVIDQEGRKLPGRPILQSACVFRYRHWTGASFDYTDATCPYVGATNFDINGNVVATGDLDVPSKRLDTCCKKRFASGTLPFGGFPGVARFQ